MTRRVDLDESELVDVTRNAYHGVNHWMLLGAVGALLVLSLIVANAIAFCVQIRREQRIRRKTTALAQSVPIAKLSTATTNEQRPLAPVPVTILTGFLGAGKTTLLNRILQTPELPYKIMVLENEIGTISIDHALLKPGTTNDDLAKDGIYVLQNGCMCCTARGSKGSSGELERILDYLLRIVNEEGFDYLVVETTGLADPGPIIETFLQLRASRFRLDAIVTMVDTHAIQRFYSREGDAFDLPVELQRQLLYADVVALNKIDLVDDAGMLARIEEAASSVSDGAVMLRCTNAELDMAQIVGVNTFDAVKFHKSDAQRAADKGAVHTQGIQTMHIEVNASVDVAKFSEWLNEVTAEYARANILRIKGLLSLSNSSRRCILQCVLDTYTMAPSTSWATDAERSCCLVIIGKNLNKPKLEAGFFACIAHTDGVDAAASSSADKKRA